MKVIKWIALGLLIIVVAGLCFMRILPGYQMYFVRSESMLPTIDAGDLVVVGPIGGPFIGSVYPGRVITFEIEPKKLITHRVIGTDGDKYITKGDAMRTPDQFRVSYDQIRGIYLFKIPYVGYLTTFIRTKLGWWLTILLPATILVILLIKDILKEAFST